MIYAKLDVRGSFGIVGAIVDTEKVMQPPRYIDITDVVPPAIGDRYSFSSGTFSTSPTESDVRLALGAVIDALEAAGLATRNF